MYTTAELIALTLLPGISSDLLRRIVDGVSTFDRFRSLSPRELALLGLKRVTIEALMGGWGGWDEGERQVELCLSAGGDILTWWDNRYPALLRQIYAPPVLLYARGSLAPPDADGVAIVGTRGASMYGRLSAERYATACAAAGVSVISGLARGIDSYAHSAVLRAGGRTVAIVACGVDRIAPTSSARLAEKIMGSGAIVSEHPFGVQAVPAYFPRRNRIISGMTRGTVVIESDERGGSMITAGFALDQNREVFALPGPVTSPKSRGTNQLIRTDRARLTQEPGDMLEVMGYCVALPSEQRKGLRAEDLTAFEARVYDALEVEPIHVDALCERTDLASSDVLVALLTLEFKGLVRQMAGKLFLRE